MLTAIHKENRTILYGPEISAEEGTALKGQIIDPIFEKPCTYVRSHFRVGNQVCSFFRTSTHQLDSSEWEKNFIPDDEYFRVINGRVSLGESNSHREGKAWLRDYYINKLKINPEEISLEQRIKMPCGRWRIADIAIGVPHGLNLVIEVQLSPIPLATLAERINDYESVGIESTWWFGDKSRNAQILDYVQEYSLGYGLLDVVCEQKRVDYDQKTC